jgi:uncharacterized protein (TIGR02145 family)
MNSTIKTIMISVISVMMLIGIRCSYSHSQIGSEQVGVVGGGTGQEISQIAGHFTIAKCFIFGPDGSPAKNAVIMVRPSNFHHTIDGLMEPKNSQEFAQCSTFSDNNGIYCLDSIINVILRSDGSELHSPDANLGKKTIASLISQFIIEAKDSLGNRTLIHKGNDLTLISLSGTLNDTLKPTVSLEGEIHNRGNLTGGYVFVRGLDAYAKINDNNTFSLPNLPVGNLRLKIIPFRDDTSGFVITLNDPAQSYFANVDIDTNPMTDIDGNKYHYLTIGNQTWMTENLRTTRFNDSKEIFAATDSARWAGLSAPGYFDRIYKFYNWRAVATRKLAPVGWHVATASDWDALQNYTNTLKYETDGTIQVFLKAKALATQYNWNTSLIDGAIGNDLNKNDATGFSAMACGYIDEVGSYVEFGNTGSWWVLDSSSYARNFSMHFDSDTGTCGRTCNNLGCSVRCVRDQVIWNVTVSAMPKKEE